MKIISLLLMLIISSAALAQNSMHCGEVQRMRVWANGSDLYGVWVEYKTNPQSCPGGFYMLHNANNKDLVYSLILSAKAQNERICIQTYDPNMNGNRCQLNYVMHP